MAYGVMPDPGGPTVCDDCDHDDCEYWRGLAGTPCDLCGDPVAGGDRYVERGDGIAHYICHLEDLEDDDG